MIFGISPLVVVALPVADFVPKKVHASVTDVCFVNQITRSHQNITIACLVDQNEFG